METVAEALERDENSNTEHILLNQTAFKCFLSLLN